jgi:hypothetical protein
MREKRIDTILFVKAGALHRGGEGGIRTSCPYGKSYWRSGLESFGGLNWSMQHWLAVYSPAFQSPRSFAGVDSGAELPC